MCNLCSATFAERFIVYNVIRALIYRKCLRPGLALDNCRIEIISFAKQVPFSFSSCFIKIENLNIVSSDLFENSCKATRNIWKLCLNPSPSNIWHVANLILYSQCYIICLHMVTAVLICLDTEICVDHCFPKCVSSFTSSIRFSMKKRKICDPNKSRKLYIIYYIPLLVIHFTLQFTKRSEKSFSKESVLLSFAQVFLHHILPLCFFENR